MKREILFRGIINEEAMGEVLPKEFVYGSLVSDEDDAKIIDERDLEWLVNMETVGQYIGAKDKHGKRIFEGDIIFDSHYEQNYICIFKNGCFGFESKTGEYFNADECNGSDIEIIGNIHENK